MSRDKGINNRYEWMCLSQFCVRTHGFPYELLEKLQFNNSYDVINKIIEINDPSNELLNQARVVFEDELNNKRKILWEIVADEKFLDALLISSPNLLNTIEIYLGKLDDILNNERNRHIREKEQRIALYLQRFCAKNDTNSFLGPTFWGVIDKEIKDNMQLKIKQEDKAQRFISYEYWAVEKIAQCINRDKEVRCFIPPKLNPSYKLNLKKNEILIPVNKKITLTNCEKQILGLCNGKNYIADIIKRLDSSFAGSNSIENINDFVCRQLEDLAKREIIIWEILLPTGLFDSLSYLITIVKNFPVTYNNKSYWLNILNKFNELKMSFPYANFHERKKILQEMDELFEKVTQEKSERNPGQTYGGRLLIFEEEAKNIEYLKLSQEFIDNASRELFPILEWYRILLFYYVKQLEQKIIERLKNDSSLARELNLEEFLDIEQQEFNKNKEELINSAISYFSQVENIKEIHQVVKDTDTIRIIEEKLEPPNQLFIEKPENDWLWLSFDIMIIADNIQEINEKKYKILIAEMHPEPLLFLGIFTWHNKLIKALNKEIVEIIKQKNVNKSLAQLCFYHKEKGFMYYPLEEIYEIERNRIMSQTDSEHIIPISDITVTLENDKIVFASCSRKLKLAIGGYLIDSNFMAMHTIYQLLSKTFQNYNPRIEVGSIILSRAKWTIKIDEQLRKRISNGGLGLFVEMLRFKKENSLPKQIFVRVKSERKPIMIDFRNYFLLENLKKILLKNEEIHITEMLPSPQQFWLEDESGRHSAEFRMMWTYREI